MTPALKGILLRGGLDPVTRAWRSSIAAVGGSVSDRTLRAHATLIRRIRAGVGLQNMLMLRPCAGDNLAASLVRSIVPVGIAASATNNNFVGGDYSEATGLTGDGATKYLDSLLNPVSLSWSASSLMQWAYTRTAIVGTGTTRVTMGAANDGGAGRKTTLLGWVNSGAYEALGIGADLSASDTQYAGKSTPSTTGFLGGGTNGSRVCTFHKNGVATGTTPTANDALPNLSIYELASNGAGTAGAFCPRAISLTAITTGLVASQRVALNAAVQEFETLLGRNVS